jgi:hypothetical protein
VTAGKDVNLYKEVPPPEKKRQHGLVKLLTGKGFYETDAGLF